MSLENSLYRTVKASETIKPTRKKHAVITRKQNDQISTRYPSFAKEIALFIGAHEAKEKQNRLQNSLQAVYEVRPQGLEPWTH